MKRNKTRPPILLACILFFGLISYSGYADSNSSLLKRANEHYAQGEFEKALESYLQIHTGGYESAELYFNIGNSYYKLSKIPEAILYYERAKLLDPLDKDIQYNLEQANQYVVDKIEALPDFFIAVWFDHLINILSSNTWIVLSAIAFVLFLLGMGAYLLSDYSLRKKLFFFSALFFLFLSMIFFTFSHIRKGDIMKREEAIIFTPSVVAKSSPDESGNDLYLLHEGTKVKIIDSLGNWREIQLSDGNIAWIELENMEII